LAEANGNLTSLNSSFLKGMKIKKNRQPAQLADRDFSLLIPLQKMMMVANNLPFRQAEEKIFF